MIPWLVTASNMKEFRLVFIHHSTVSYGRSSTSEKSLTEIPTIVKFISNNKMSRGGRFSNFVRKHLKQIISFKTNREEDGKV